MRFLLIMSLLVLLPSSSFFLPAYLNQILAKGEHSQAQLAYALRADLPAAWRFELKQARYGSSSWLALSEKLAISDAGVAVELANYYQAQLKLPEAGDTYRRQAVFWYQQGIRLGSPKARLALAQFYFDADQLLQAQSTARDGLDISRFNAETPKVKHALLRLLAKTAIARGETDEIQGYLPLLELSGPGRELAADIKRFQVLASGTAQVPAGGAACPASIQLFATRIGHLHYLEQLIDGVEAGPLAPFVCFAPVRYRRLQALACREDTLSENGYQAKKRRAISCREALWRQDAGSIPSRFLGVLLPQGGANVHLGILYIDSKDSLDVFTHELSHLLGFVDEYPLPAHHNRCSSVQQAPFAHNLAVLAEYYRGERRQVRARVLRQLPWRGQILDDTPILQAQGKGWRLGTPAEYAKRVGVFPARSCDRQKPQAFKPLSGRTKLAYYEEAFPQAYLQRLAARPYDYLMPSFHYNIALALFLQDELAQAKYWLEQSALWETDPGRKAKILAGDF
ncbi:hypothetical protein SG34_009130 [Thalassomonas viridans]|uniref:Uncharacterized protein n=1 Tax=Thalassomonas viridans TaxID=137584 RepID=A0AAE9Z684_9GAMM|nr:hypothetical protein [Thalassomonas viridans]WDE07027.1 hypothetical protein SG34_009130 [Thalassomonas viridans]